MSTMECIWPSRLGSRKFCKLKRVQRTSDQIASAEIHETLLGNEF
jgi:hypothetical protein